MARALISAATHQQRRRRRRRRRRQRWRHSCAACARCEVNVRRQITKATKNQSGALSAQLIANSSVYIKDTVPRSRSPTVHCLLAFCVPRSSVQRVRAPTEMLNLNLHWNLRIPKTTRYAASAPNWARGAGQRLRTVWPTRFVSARKAAHIYIYHLACLIFRSKRTTELELSIINLLSG